ncbi:uncharacterized protein LOC144637782 [Oculina patagonica]
MATQNIQIATPVSEKTPVQNPPTPTFPISPEHNKPVQAGGDSRYEVNIFRESDQSTEEARKPVQETPNPKKAFDFSEIEALKERPVQESKNPNSTSGTAETENNSLQHVLEFAEGKPVQESEDLKGKKDASDHPEGGTRIVHEELVENKPLQETEEPSNTKLRVEIECQRKESDEQPFHEQDFEEFDKEKPVQETQGPGKGQGTVVQETGQTGQVKEGKKVHEEITEGRLVRESASSYAETESCKEEALPTQETMAARKGPFEETGKTEGPEADETGQVKESETLHEEITEGKPVQEGDVETESCKEEALPTQETMAAGKGPFEETGKTHGTEAEETSQVKEGEALHEKIIEGKPLQENDVETESCKEEALPTQETMAAGKGPFEETGLQVGVKGQPTDEQE